MKGLSTDPLRGLVRDRRNGPQAVRNILPNGSGAEWQEGDTTVKGQVWTEHPNEHRVWLAVAQGFPGEMRQARYDDGTIRSVDPTVYDCLGRRYHSCDPEPPKEAEAVQGTLFEAPAPEPPPLETLPLF